MFNNYIAHQTTEVGGKNHQLKSAEKIAGWICTGKTTTTHDPQSTNGPNGKKISCEMLLWAKFVVWICE